MSDIAKMIAFSKMFGGGSSTPAPVVILPETELTYDETEEAFFLLSPLPVEPVAGGVYVVTYNGVDYECEGVPNTGSGLPVDPVLLGNCTLASLNGGNADAPFVMICYSNESNGAMGFYAALVNTDGATSVTLSIVQTESGSDDSESGESMVFTTHTTCTQNSSEGHDFSGFDATYAQLKAAFDADKHIRIVCTFDNGQIVIGRIIASRPGGVIMEIPGTALTATVSTRYYILGAGDSGEIIWQLLSD